MQQMTGGVELGAGSFGKVYTWDDLQTTFCYGFVVRDYDGAIVSLDGIDTEHLVFKVFKGRDEKSNREFIAEKGANKRIHELFRGTGVPTTLHEKIATVSCGSFNALVMRRMHGDVVGRKWNFRDLKRMAEACLVFIDMLGMDSLNLMHSDIATRNIFTDLEGNFVVGDYGMLLPFHEWLRTTHYPLLFLAISQKVLNYTDFQRLIDKPQAMVEYFRTQCLKKVESETYDEVVCQLYKYDLTILHNEIRQLEVSHAQLGGITSLMDCLMDNTLDRDVAIQQCLHNLRTVKTK